MIFIIHLHRSKSDRFYLRLEKDGVLKNWAIPKGIPDSPGPKRLAVQIRDGELSVVGFVGPISKGEFGRGVISIWDKGTYTPISWQADKISFQLQGDKSSGTYSMERFPKAGKDCWTISKVEAQSLKPPPLPPPASVAARPGFPAPPRKRETNRPRRSQSSPPAPASARPGFPAPPRKRETNRPVKSQSPAPRAKRPFSPKSKKGWGGASKSGGGHPSLATWWMRK
jgi:bifunctional non-homologous end joining protein LigD